MFHTFQSSAELARAQTLHRRGQAFGFRFGFECLEPRILMAGDAILHWNAIALDAVSRDHSSLNGNSPAAENIGPCRAARVLAIVQTAMFDAINSIKGKYEPYLLKVVGSSAANIDAAVGQAAHDTLIALYKRQKSEIDAALMEWLGDVKNGPAEQMGIALGKTVAKTILAARKNDGSQAASDYEIVNLPGHHQKDPLNPTQGLLDPQWGGVKTFGIKHADKFLPPPPPKLSSPQYAQALDEIVRLGGDGVTTPTLRTQEQTEIGIFWAYDGTQGLCAPPRMYNQIAAKIAVEHGNSEYENARMFALVNIAMADAGIVGWGAKYDYDFWRPVVGIRGADLDGNPQTHQIANWTPLGAPASNETFPNDFTPPFPSYVSGHAIFGASLFKTLEYFYGTKHISFSFTSDEFNGETTDHNGVARPEITRHFDNLRDAAYENGISRIYLGIHWRFDMEEGVRAGNRIAVNIFRRLMEPLDPSMPTGTTSGLLMSYFQTTVDCKFMDIEDGTHRQVAMMQTIVTPEKTTYQFSSLSPTFISTASTYTNSRPPRIGAAADNLLRVEPLADLMSL
ncbi:MAG: phosphatase PAP2 family protein [Pirellulales bacterium]|nr:phosphatase PAP2 family protein [Pirellulales bacterium]